MCGQLNLIYKEKNIDQYDVYTADEAFMSGTPFCLLPVTKLNSVNIGSGKPGEIFSRLLEKWSNNMMVDIKKQIKDWDNQNNIKLDAPTPYRFN